MKTNHARPSMPDELQKQGRQITIRESEGYIVPVKPGNSGGGKVAKRWWNWILGIPWTQSQTLDDNSNPFPIATHAWRDGHRGEPDALTAHVRFWEGADLNRTWLQYCDTTTGNPVDNG